MQWKRIIQLQLPLSLTNPKTTPKTPLTSLPGNRKSQLSQSAMEENHPVAIALTTPKTTPKTPLTSIPGNRKSQLSQSAMEKNHPVAIATLPHQPKNHTQNHTNLPSWQSQESTQTKCNGRESSSCDCHSPSPTRKPHPKPH